MSLKDFRKKKWIKKRLMRRPGIEPGSRDWETRMLTTTPTAQPYQFHGYIQIRNYPNITQISFCMEYLCGKN